MSYKPQVPTLTFRGNRILGGSSYVIAAHISLYGNPKQVRQHLNDSVRRLLKLNLVVYRFSIAEKDLEDLYQGLFYDGPRPSEPITVLFGYPLTVLKGYGFKDETRGVGKPPKLEQRNIRG